MSASPEVRDEGERRRSAEIEQILAEARSEAARVLELVRGLEPTSATAMSRVAAADPTRPAESIEVSGATGITVAEWCRELDASDQPLVLPFTVALHEPASITDIDHDSTSALRIVERGDGQSPSSSFGSLARLRALFVRRDSLVVEVVAPMLLLLVVLGLLLALVG